MEKKPLVSILMTAYNREAYIGFAIDSVLASTYTHWELIIVDDCSVDKTVSIARQYAERDPRIKVYVNEKNLGDYPNRNKAAEYAQGKYLKYIDADDAIYYWGLEVEVEMMERFPEAGYGLDSIEQDDNRIFPYVLLPAEAYNAYYIKKMGFFDRAPTSCIIKRDIFLLEEGFKALRMVGDCEMWHRLSLKYPVVLMPHGIIWSRGHQDSESGKLKNEFLIQYHYRLVNRQSLEHDKCPLENVQKRRLIKTIAMSQLKIIIKTIFKGDIKTLRGIKKLEFNGVMNLLRLSFGY